MVGAPGAGKGTQAGLLSQRLDIPHIASGDLFRDNIKRGTSLGRKVKKYLDAGALVPDDITMAMIGDRLSDSDATDGAVLDGFPRTRPQAEAFDRMLQKKGGRVAAALYIDVDRDELIRRLSGRWLCTKSADHVYHATANPPETEGACNIDGARLYQRDDDKPKTISARLEQQLPPMFEVIDYYTDRRVLSTVEGDKPIAEVTEDLVHAIELCNQALAAENGTLGKRNHAKASRAASASDGRTPAAPGADRFARSGGPKAVRGGAT